jgi:SAM-dependent methyltransferase
MNLADIVSRACPPEPWAEGDNIPWNEPGFSARMLREHLSQAHDAASRRLEIIDQHVAWIFGSVLGGQPARVLDLGCGPGLYSHRLAALGCACTGVDFSPASIEYARARVAGLPCTYQLADLRRASFGEGHDLAMLLYGEANVFRPADLRLILRKAWAALRPDGQVLLEAHTLEAVEAMGHEAASWSAHDAGLFSDQPHVLLSETFWEAAGRTATNRYYVLDAASDTVTRYAQSRHGYTEAGYRDLLAACGFEAVRSYPSLTGDVAVSHPGLFVLTATQSLAADAGGMSTNVPYHAINPVEGQ